MIGKAEPDWRRARICHANGTCVEVAAIGGTSFGVRDAKDVSLGHIGLTGPAFRRFLDKVRTTAWKS